METSDHASDLWAMWYPMDQMICFIWSHMVFVWHAPYPLGEIFKILKKQFRRNWVKKLIFYHPVLFISSGLWVKAFDFKFWNFDSNEKAQLEDSNGKAELSQLVSKFQIGIARSSSVWFAKPVKLSLNFLENSKVNVSKWKLAIFSESIRLEHSWIKNLDSRD